VSAAPKTLPSWAASVMWGLDDTTILKSSGMIVSPVRCPLPEEIRIDDIAHSLARMCRWAGDVDDFFSVAQHSVIVSTIIQDPRFKLLGLLHDATEAYLCDLPAPAKRALPDYQDAEAKLLKVIGQKFGFTCEGAKAVKMADRVVLCAEARDLFSPPRDFICPGQYRDIADEFIPTIRPLDYRSAERQFLARFEELTTRTVIMEATCH
jgi:uncharacterized protein